MKTIILSDEQYAALQTALSYAAEQRLYEASQTTDGVDRVEIEACAHEWGKLQDVLNNNVESVENIQVKVFFWQGCPNGVLANTAIDNVEIISAEDWNEDMSDEDAADEYKEKLINEGFFQVPYEEGIYQNANGDNDE